MASYGDAIEGLTILVGYESEGVDSHNICAEHDTIFAGPGLPPDRMKPLDATRLEALGWGYSKSEGGWYRFV